MDTIQTYLIEIGKRAKKAQVAMVQKSTIEKNKALEAIAKELKDNAPAIVKANEKDMELAKQNNMRKSMFDRLLLTEERIEEIAHSVLDVVTLPDPIGNTLEGFQNPNGLNILKEVVPLGVIGMIYEARPNVTVDAAVLCLKTSNVAILKGGKEAFYSNKILVEIMRSALKKTGFPEDAILFIESTEREATKQFMKLNGYLDVLIPRGGANLIKAVMEEATVPVIETGTGNCHMFVDESANFTMAKDIAINARVQRPSVCNSLESLLIHKNIAKEFVPFVYEAFKEQGVTFLGDKICQSYLSDSIALATEEDYATEFNDLIISVKVVEDIQEAMEHISLYSTKHSECIVTENLQNAQLFTKVVDAAAVYVNASTRFTDGGEFGFGAEIGISTQKLHARGPMGLKEMTSYKYIVLGNGQIR